MCLRSFRSRVAAVKGISQVVLSRNAIMAPGMLLMPFVMQAMERRAWFARRPALHGPFQVACVGCFLVLMVPAGCAIFPQSCALKTDTLRKVDPGAYAELEARFAKNPEKMPEVLYFNKGL